MPPEAQNAGNGDPMQEIVERVRQITRENERLFQQLISGERRFRILSKAVWKVQEEERRRLARELHDGIGQTLTALKNQLEWLEGKARAADDPLESEVAGAVELAAHALDDTRELSRLLRPPVLDDLGLVPALRWLVRTIGQRNEFTVALSVDGIEDRLDADVETLVFRVVQEALNNVVKHSGASRADVQLAQSNGRVRVEIFDSGCGFDVADKMEDTQGRLSGFGLRGIHDRVELFGGQVRIRSVEGEGTRLEIDVPLVDLTGINGEPG